MHNFVTELILSSLLNQDRSIYERWVYIIAVGDVAMVKPMGGQTTAREHL